MSDAIQDVDLVRSENDETLHKARLVVATNARDHDDALELMDALGLM